MTFELYPHQMKMVNDARAAIAQHRSCLLRSPTGSGKTVVASYIIKQALEKNKTVIFTVHRRELLKQTMDTFNEFGIQYGLIAAGYPMNLKQPIQIASIETLRRRLKQIKIPHLLVIDEANHAVSNSWLQVINHFGEAFHLLLTATPKRLDGRGLGAIAKSMVHGPETRWLIDNKFLAPYRAFAPSAPDLSGVHTQMGDYKMDELAAKMDKPTITGDAVDHYLRICPGTRAIAFATNIAHSKNIALKFNGAGIPARHIDGTMPKSERDSAIDLFRRGDIKILTNCDIISEGFDVPAMETAILLRPTQSLSLYLQQVGRALRYQPGKTAVILDHSGNLERHGLPCSKFEWTLDDKKKRASKGERATPINQCAVCYFVWEIGDNVCPNCGEEKNKERTVEYRKGELEEIDIDSFEIKQQKKKEVREAKTIDELKRIMIERKYKWGWHLHQARQKGITA